MFTHPDDLIVLSAHEIRKAHPEVSFPPDITEEHVADLGYLPIEQDVRPDLGPREVLEPGEIRIEDGKAYQGWTVVQIPEPATHEVTMRQARLALFQSEILHLVDGIIDAMDEPARSAARIEWEYAATVKINSPIVQHLCTRLELTDEQAQKMFEEAAKL